MKLKSLLLGSAAAMFVVSGANAADAVFAAEPEPMDYVKVCDTYGNGFHYIPGTETCLKFSGYVRSEYIYTDAPDTPASVAVTAATTLEASAAAPVAVAAPVVDGTTITGVVQVGAAGPLTLYSVTRTTRATTAAADNVTGDWRYRARLNIDARNETDWGTLRSQIRIQGDGRGGGDADAVIDRALISLGGLRLGYSDTYFTTHHGYGWQYAANDGYYNYDQAIFLDYTFAANGFSATVGIQDSTSTGPAASGSDVIDIYGGAAYSGSWGRIAGSVIYDSSADELAWKVSADISAIENVGIHAWYSADSGGTMYVTGYSSAAVEWQWGVDVSYKVNSQFTVWAGYTDADFTDAERFAVGAHWNPVSGLSIRPEAVFGEDYTQVRLRVVRSF